MNGEVREKIPNVFLLPGEEPKSDDSLPGVSALCAFPKGMIFGSPYGHMAVWIKSESDDENANLFIPVRIWHLERKSSICTINCTPSGESIAVSFASNDIATFNIAEAIPTTS